MLSYKIPFIHLTAASTFNNLWTVLETEEKYNTYYARNLLIYPERSFIGRINGNLICTLR